MMTTHDEDNLDPRMGEFKNEMFNLCTGLANIANEIGRSQPSWGLDLADQVNAKLDKAIENVARLPDEVAGSILQVAGAHIHTIGRLMADSFTSPAIVAPLARSGVEYCALLLFITRDEEPEVRTVRAARALRVGMKIDKAHKQKDLEGLYSGLNRIVERYTRKHFIPELKHDKEKIAHIVRQTSGELVGEDFYDMLSAYAHYNAWKALFQLSAADANPTVLELDSLYFAQKSALALAGASLTILNYREEASTEVLREALNFQTEQFLKIGERINDFQGSL